MCLRPQTIQSNNSEKNVKAKKSLPSNLANYISGQLIQSDQAKTRPNKKESHPCQGDMDVRKAKLQQQRLMQLLYERYKGQDGPHLIGMLQQS